MPKQKQIKPEKLIISEEVKSGSYLKFAKSHKVFVVGFVVFFLALVLIPDSQDKSKEAFGTFIALFGMSGFIACVVSVFMFFADIVTMFKIRKKSGYKKSIFQEIKENQKEFDEKIKYPLKGAAAQTENTLTFTATIQTKNIKTNNLKQTISYKIQGRHFYGVPFCNQNCKVAVAIYDGTIYVEDLERHKSIYKFEVDTIINAQLQFNDAIPYLVIQTQTSEYIFEAKEKEILKMVTSIKETLKVIQQAYY